MNYKKPEILAPAGSMEALKAAISAGADAVYLGGTMFGARAFANNFDKDNLIQAIEYAHLYGVKIYLTINTLLTDNELEQLFDYLLPFYQTGLDAVIVQDLGVMCYVHENFPDLPIHASTQMTITTPYAYTLLKEYGVNRIVPARELSIKEISALKSTTAVPEVEVFVQGALCYCYSGQCLMSSMLGGRSGNRGRCAQTCRLPYQLEDKEHKDVSTKGSHLLSPKDLCGLESIPKLVKAGVDSFKIEGRMKKPEYVAACVRAYRQAVDAYFEDKLTDKLIEKLKSEMADVFNRGGFTKGYYDKKNGSDMMSIKNPGNVGVCIGKITEITKNQITILLNHSVSKGDIFVLNGKNGDITLTCNVEEDKKHTIRLNSPRTRELKVGQLVFRMRNAALEEALSKYLQTEPEIAVNARIELFEGQNARLFLETMIKDNKIDTVVEGNMVATASARPLTKETVYDKVAKTGQQGMYFSNLDIQLSDAPFYGLKDLKELRREGLAKLRESIIAKSYRQEVVKSKRKHNSRQSEYSPITTAMVSDEEQLKMVQKEALIEGIYIDLQFFDINKLKELLLLDTSKNYYLVLPPILRNHILVELESIYTEYLESNRLFAGLVVRNIDELAFLFSKGYKGELVTDYSLYAMNNEAVAFYETLFHNIRITLPVELNRQQLSGLKKEITSSELVVYGYQQLMVSAQCMTETVTGCNRANSEFFLKDRYQKDFLVVAVCKYCYNLIYNCLPTLLFDVADKECRCNCFRLHFTVETPEEVKDIMDSCFRQKAFTKDKTRGHYNRGVD